jgi:outer membrane protein OmpA-like peptidoglycan-associated protein
VGLFFSGLSSVSVTPEFGNVAAQGTSTVSPRQSTTYTATATGPGGSATASTHVTVTVAAAAAPAPDGPTIEEMFTREVQDAFFDYDKADIRADARQALSKTADFLRSYPQVAIVIEGHCDERGSTEYNLASGDRRSDSAKDFLVALGVAADRIQTVSYGKERPFCTVSRGVLAAKPACTCTHGRDELQSAQWQLELPGHRVEESTRKLLQHRIQQVAYRFNRNHQPGWRFLQWYFSVSLMRWIRAAMMVS